MWENFKFCVSFFFLENYLNKFVPQITIKKYLRRFCFVVFKLQEKMSKIFFNKLKSVPMIY